MKYCSISLIITLSFSSIALANSEHLSDYSGQQNRSIKSLSAADIADLKAGAGWGLAKAAELNGVPGPMHLLEMQDEIELTAPQRARIQKVFDAMRTEAQSLGEQLIVQESELDAKFRSKLPDERELRMMLDQIESTRSALRYVHLSAHLLMPDILSRDQIRNYNSLRGYDNADPCQSVPSGHDATMWKKHNGCE